MGLNSAVDLCKSLSLKSLSQILFVSIGKKKAVGEKWREYHNSTGLAGGRDLSSWYLCMCRSSDIM